MTKLVSSVFLAAGVTAISWGLGTQPAAACGYDTLDGSICYTAATYCPAGFYAVYGQSMAIVEDQALYSLIGSYFGGDWKNVFNVPDLRSRTPIAVGTGAGLETIDYAQYYGVTAAALYYANMPAHTHTPSFGVDSSRMSMTGRLQAAGQTGTAVVPSNGISTLSGISNSVKLWASSLGNTPVMLGGWISQPSGGFESGAMVENAVTGQGIPFPTLPPGLGLTACIASSYQPYPIKP